MSKEARDYLRWALKPLRDIGWSWHDLRKVIEEIIGEGVTPSEPASPAPSLLGLIGRRLTRWA